MRRWSDALQSSHKHRTGFWGTADVVWYSPIPIFFCKLLCAQISARHPGTICTISGRCGANTRIGSDFPFTKIGGNVVNSISVLQLS